MSAPDTVTLTREQWDKLNSALSNQASAIQSILGALKSLDERTDTLREISEIHAALLEGQARAINRLNGHEDYVN